MSSFICDDCAEKYEAKPKSGIVTRHMGECKYCGNERAMLTPVRDFWLKKDTPPYEYWLGPSDKVDKFDEIIKAVHSKTIRDGYGFVLVEEEE